MIRDLAAIILNLVDENRVFKNIHIEEGEPFMVLSPKGWEEVEPEMPILREELNALLGQLNRHWEERIANGGSFNHSMTLSSCRLRCNVFWVRAGERLVCSIRRQPLQPMSIEAVGLPPYIKNLVDHRKGLILMTGQTGAGKTTASMALLDHINTTRRAHIITIEDPIEYELHRKQSIISPREVGIDCNSYAQGLKDAVRQMPDVIMVGEVRDRDTAETVLHAADSGHLVIATLHTPSAPAAIQKLLSFLPADERDARCQALATSLIAVFCLSLMPSYSSESYVLASEILANHDQQLQKFLLDVHKLPQLADWLKTAPDGYSRSLNHHLVSLVHQRSIQKSEAMKASNNRMELSERIKHLPD